MPDPIKVEQNQTAAPVSADTRSGNTMGWQLASGLIAAVLLMVFVLYRDSITSAVSLWWNRSAYNHGFIIIPISAYLLWDKRAELAAMAPRPGALGLFIALGSSVAWLVARSAGISEGEHFAVVGVIQGVVMAILGYRIFVAMILPMSYLWLMVPTGALFYPFLQQIAHSLSAAMLKLSGITVFAEGYYIEVPTGIYQVTEGCSGLNFILAGLALAPLYGYLFYSSLRKRIIAVVVMLMIAVLANGFRIFAIIALAEFTNRRIDIVDDHLLYGWGFFAITLLICGILAARFADPAAHHGHAASGGEASQAGAMASAGTGLKLLQRRLAVGGMLALFAVALLPLYRVWTVSLAEVEGRARVDVTVLGLDVSPASGLWRPQFSGADQSVLTGVTKPGAARGAGGIDLFAAVYAWQGEGHEVIGTSNDLMDRARFNDRGGFVRNIEMAGMGGAVVPWRFERLRQGQASRLVAYTYQVDGRYMVSNLEAKLLQAKTTLLWGRKDAGVLALSVAAHEGFDLAADELEVLIGTLSLDGLFVPPADPQS